MQEIIVLGLTLVWLLMMAESVFKRRFNLSAVGFLGSMGGSAGTFLNPFSQIRKGSNEQQQGITNSENYENQSYKENQGYLQPWQDLSTQSMASYRDLMGYNGEEGKARAMAQFRSDPGYQFAMDESLNQGQKTAVGKGNLYSGRTLMALQDRAKGLADQGYNNYYNRVNNGVQMGQGTTAAQIGLTGNHYNTLSGLNLQRAGIKANEYQQYTDLRNLANDKTMQWISMFRPGSKVNTSNNKTNNGNDSYA